MHPLLHRLVDYAGLFPPARLPLAEAAALYARHRARPEAPMLARFVVPVAQVEMLGALLPPSLPTPLAALGTGGPDVKTFLAATTADLAALRAALDAHPSLSADAFEVRLPDEVVHDPALAAGVLAALDVLRAGHRLPDLRFFLEVPLTSEGRAGLPVLLGVFFEAGAALKLRTGGLTAEAFPSSEALAHAIVSAHRAGVAFKATAGLHHPVRQYRDEVQGVMHGFLNVFGGACLLHAAAIGAGELTRVLEETDPGALRLDSDGTFAWHEVQTGAEAVAAARAGFALGFGSCSFDEPVDDLRALGVVV